MTVTFRDFDHDRDIEAVRRIYREVGWLADELESTDVFVNAARARVAELNGAPECLVLSAPGEMQYAGHPLPLGCITGVTTSYVARKQGLAGRLTANVIAADVADGAIVSILGMFEQGYYNRLGFGSASYDLRVMLEPAGLQVEPATRVPCRLTKDDWEEVHACRLRRMRGHGSVTLTPGALSRAEMIAAPKGFGLGFRDAAGTLTHHMWLAIQADVEFGPYAVWWMAYETPEQFLELMGTLKNLGDQVQGVKVWEPGWIQLQDLVRKPFGRMRTTRKGDFQSDTVAYAWWQARMNDVPACLERTHLPADDLRFNLTLTDPIEGLLPDDGPWRGVAGDYVVTLGRNSGAERGVDASLPTLRASVNGFTRLWLGVRPARGIAVVDDLAGPDDLLAALDETILVPRPNADWSF